MKLNLPIPFTDWRLKGHDPKAPAKTLPEGVTQKTFGYLKLQRRNDATPPRNGQLPLAAPSTGVAPVSTDPVRESARPAREEASSALAAKDVLRQRKNADEKTLDPAVASMTAPVREIPDAEFSRMVRDLRRDIQAWLSGGGLEQLPADLRTHARDAQQMLTLASSPDERNLGYFVGERLQGLMTLARVGNEMEVSIIATHPGTAGAGGALIEQAVNLAEAQGCAGVVKLSPLKGATAAYEAMGFKATGVEEYMAVDPRQAPEIWARKDGQWRLRKHQDKNYVVAMKSSSPLPAPADPAPGS